MNYDEISTFLAVVEHKNIAKAADSIYIGQGIASSRIMNLEDELGVRLLFRQKGLKTITLTPEGEYFLPIAQQIFTLWQQAQHIKTNQVNKELRIAAIDSLNRFMFTDVYKEFMNKNPNTSLFIQTEHSTEIHHLIETQEIDVGFVFNLHKSSSITAIPLYQEKLVILHHKHSVFEQTHKIKSLDFEKEIGSIFSSEMEIWHQRHFQCASSRRVTIGTMSMLPSFIADEQSWSIVPESFANMMINKNSDLSYSEITDDVPPPRTAYILFYKYPKPWVRELANLFLRDVLQMVKANPSLQLIYKE